MPAPARLWLGGIGDFYVLDNFNSPASGENQLRQFDVAQRQGLGQPGAPDAGAESRAASAFASTSPSATPPMSFFMEDPAAARHPDVARLFSHFEQAFVTRGGAGRRATLAVEVGKFNTPVGLEDNESPANWNYSRSLIFTFAEPTLHTGVRLTVVPTPTLGVSLYWINGWNSNFLDGSDLRSWAAAATWRPREGLEIALVYIGGYEHPPSLLADPHLTLAPRRRRLPALVAVALAVARGQRRLRQRSRARRRRASGAWPAMRSGAADGVELAWRCAASTSPTPTASPPAPCRA